MRKFGLGYSLPGWDNFVAYAQDKKLDLERAVFLGLIGQSKDGRLYDRFSGRIIFPIFSPQRPRCCICRQNIGRQRCQ